MESVCCLRAVVSLTYQAPYAGTVQNALSACKKFGPRCRVHRVTHEHIARLNAVSETVLANSISVAKAYCRALACIVAWGRDLPITDDIVLDPTTVARVLVAMNSHAADAHMQEEGLYALSALTKFNRANSAGVLEHGGLSTLFSAADTHEGAGNIQNVVCIVLYNVALFADHGKAVLRSSQAADLAKRTTETHSWFHTPHLLLYQLSV